MTSRKPEEPQLASMQLERDVAVVTIDNPPLNILSKAVKGQLLEIFLSLRERRDVRAVVLQGSGTKAFSAGADIREFPQRIAEGSAGQVAREGHALINALRGCGKPTVAVVDGVAYGAGLELILAADFRLATDRAAFALPEATRGVFPGNGGTQLLPRIIGAAHAIDLMLSGTPIGAAEAHRIGLVSRLIPAKGPASEALRFAEHLASLPTTAVASIRRLVWTATESQLAEGLDLEAQLFAEVFRTEAVTEGVNAFREKRDPDFRRVEHSH